MDFLQIMNERAQGTLGDTLGMELLEVTKERVRARMPVTKKVHQPFGLLHGGASVALAETVCSIGAWMNVDQATQAAVGLEINANHIRGVRDGAVIGTATPVHLGRTTQIWEIKIEDEEGRLVCISRCTMAVITK